MTPQLIVWPGGEHPFCLDLSSMEGLQKATDCGPQWILTLVRGGQWRTDMLFETLRWGLIGGGMAPMEAKDLVARAVSRHPWAEFLAPVSTILLHALYGPEDDPVGEDTPVMPTPETEKTVG